jgi:hypothetical protein
MTEHVINVRKIIVMGSVMNNVELAEGFIYCKQTLEKNELTISLMGGGIDEFWVRKEGNTIYQTKYISNLVAFTEGIKYAGK